jgi:Spy/CpxP family protein refolding chaperone
MEAIMKSRALWLCAIIVVATAVVLAQDPPQQPESPQHPAPANQPQQPYPHAPRPAGPPHQPNGPPQQPGQPHPPDQPPQPHDPLAGNLFPPELVMQHRRELGLTDEQKAAIRDEAIKASTRFQELQWQMQDEMETMAGLMKGATIDEQQALAQLDKVLNIEREVKRTQLGLSIKIKNKLTAEQQMKLNDLRRHLPPR